ncbi:hypothetical protein [Paenarthrobacter nicotinovorans]|uniref:hypothetical protein n=1 Tax=Paenarthrobacter nicotinovorans TaxID=29320 RepID=UPI003D66BC41
MMGKFLAPCFEDVLKDIRAVREAGAGRLRGLPLPALRHICVAVDLTDVVGEEPAPVVQLLRDAVDELGGGALQESAEYSLGLTAGTALWNSRLRREKAASLQNIVADTFRKKPEKELLSLIAESILAICHDAKLRRARLEMEHRRHPADSRLAVQWVERFEAYYRIWTPVYALAANLEAALDTYQEEPSDHLPWDQASTQPYDPVFQARGYARDALYNYAQFQLELKRFMSRHGGHWLLSDAETEQEVADAVYAIGWHNDINADDDSFLRRHLADTKHGELDHYWDILQAFPRGVAIHDIWQQMIEEGVGLTTENERKTSQVWLTVQACQRYCDLIDADWIKIADWYRQGAAPNRREGGKELYMSLTRSRIPRAESASLLHDKSIGFGTVSGALEN